MLSNDIRLSGKSLLVVSYILSTIYIVFFSVEAIQSWGSGWAQGAIVLACTLPALIVLLNKWSDLFKNRTWPVEIKIVLIIVFLGILNVCFSEDQNASFKGMGLFLMSGIMAFVISYFMFDDKQAQWWFFNLCSFCFVFLLVFGAFEFIEQFNISGKRILLFSENPIPAGSLLILLAIGPLILLTKSKNNWQRFTWVFCLLSGALLITLIAQRGPALSMILMAFFLAATKRKGIWVFTLVALILAGAGYQLSEKVPEKLKKEILRKETLLVRLEFYHITLEILKEKPIFGLGFNSSLSRFIPNDYEPVTYPNDSQSNFKGMVAGVKVFDNMFLCFLGEAGGFFTLAYTGLILYLLMGAYKNRQSDSHERIYTILILIVLVGFVSHSTTFDSLKYPHLNWIFHSLLGLIARCNVSDQKFKLTVDAPSRSEPRLR
jgi:O-antigen ligase